MNANSLVATTIKNYTVERHLARGGMADVYVARDIQTNGLVALKVVPKSASEHSERFLREARTTANLHHPHILPALDFGEFDIWYYLITPYITSGTLRDHLTAHGPLTLQETSTLFAQLSSALQYAHEHGVLHRDIKASNVLLRDPSFAYLADFGLVKSVEDDYSLTTTGYTVGTPEYMAPELLEGDATPASDIYALGILLYQMLTGAVPFKGNTPVATILKHLQEQPVPPTRLNARIPPAVEAVILQALQKQPQQRFQTMQKFWLAFEEALEEEDRTVRHQAVQIAAAEPTIAIERPPVPSVVYQPVQPGAFTTENSRSKLLQRPQLLLTALIALFCVLVLGLLFTIAQPLFSTTNNHGAQLTPVSTTTAPASTAPAVQPTATPGHGHDNRPPHKHKGGDNQGGGD